MTTTTSEPITKLAELESEPVCIVVNAISDSDVIVYVYYVDLKEEKKESTSLEPAIRIPGVEATALVVVSKSTLYIFDFEESAEDEWQNTAYKHRLDGTERGDVIELDSCEQIKAMASLKYNPCVALIEVESQTRICVFSRILEQGTTDNFEVYEPEADQWRALPEPLACDSGTQSVDYFFVDGPRFFAYTTGGSFSIDLSQSDGLNWERLHLNIAIPPHITPLVRDGGWVVTPRMQLLDMFDPYYGRRVEFSRHVKKRHPFVSPDDNCIVRVAPEGGERLRACVVQLRYSDEGALWPRVLELYLLQFHGNKLIPDLAFSGSFLLEEDVFKCISRLWILGIFPM